MTSPCQRSLYVKQANIEHEGIKYWMRGRPAAILSCTLPTLLSGLCFQSALPLYRCPYHSFPLSPLRLFPNPTSGSRVYS